MFKSLSLLLSFNQYREGSSKKSVARTREADPSPFKERTNYRLIPFATLCSFHLPLLLLPDPILHIGPTFLVSLSPAAEESCSQLNGSLSLSLLLTRSLANPLHLPDPIQHSPIPARLRRRRWPRNKARNGSEQKVAFPALYVQQTDGRTIQGLSRYGGWRGTRLYIVQRAAFPIPPQLRSDLW